MDCKADIVVLGAGLSGCSTAIRLAEAGVRPLVIDRARFPRNAVGEGLSPICTQFLDELGILDKVDAQHFRKLSAQIVAPNGMMAYTQVDTQRPPYADGLHAFPHGYNVHRRDFDMLFLNRAIEAGAEIRQETRLVNVELDEAGAVCGLTVKEESGRSYRIETRLVIDCSGRQSHLAKQLGLRAPLADVFDGQWANFAVRLYFHNLNFAPLRATAGNGYHPGTVSFAPYHHCWYWVIPVSSELCSVGFVARRRMHKFVNTSEDSGAAAIRLISQHPVLREVIAGADLVKDDVLVTSQLGHMNGHFAGPGFMCVGDAAFFADPVWATGMTIGLKTSKKAVEFAVQMLERGEFDGELILEYDRQFRAYLQDPVSSIRAYNYYYNDTSFVDFLVGEMKRTPLEMDILGAVLFDYQSHKEFDKWTFRMLKRYVAQSGEMPRIDRMSQLNFETLQAGHLASAPGGA
jgi:flavin-dependent dehydrogenase